MTRMLKNDYRNAKTFVNKYRILTSYDFKAASNLYLCLKIFDKREKC